MSLVKLIAMIPGIIRIGTEQYAMPARLRGCRVIGTLGNFDGIHIGHQSLLRRLQREKEGCKRENAATDIKSVLISFYPHPAVVLGHAELPARLTSLREMVEQLGEFDLDYLCLIHFSKTLSQRSAADFIDQFLFQVLDLSFLVVGEDAAVGNGRQGDTGFIRSRFEGAGREVVVSSFIESGGERVSSGRIRRLLKAGELSEAQILLGREYSITACIVHGSGRGRQLGFPTVNLNYRGHVVPRKGVYACRAVIDGDIYRAVANVGVRPTFGDGRLQVEAHLPDWSGGELYGRRLSLQFVSFIRDEKNFEGVKQLKEQIDLDCKEADRILS